MKILIINKFLHPNGGSETYIFKLGRQLQTIGHQVQYFGMEHENRIVGNRIGVYTNNMDFHGGSKIAKLTYPIKTIYSVEARKKLRQVLDDFQPDVCHINNFNFQLTPSILLEIRKWEKQANHPCRIIYTAHDLQLVCPNHMCRNFSTGEPCERCLSNSFLSCIKGKCIHGSLAKSVIGTIEATFWRWMGVYRKIDTIICCSAFLKTKLDTNPILAEKTLAMHNFVDEIEKKQVEKKNYILYFGRFSKEKGTATMVQVAKELPEIPFVFAGSGPLEYLLEGIPNIRNVGFQSGNALETLVREAKFAVCPSECYENCPFSVMESQMYGTPVLGADIGGIPELIRVGETGELFESGNAVSLKEKILSLWSDPIRTARYSENAAQIRFAVLEQYTDELVKTIYATEKTK